MILVTPGHKTGLQTVNDYMMFLIDTKTILDQAPTQHPTWNKLAAIMFFQISRMLEKSNS